MLLQKCNGRRCRKGMVDLSEKHAGSEQEALAVFAMKATENKNEVQKESSNSKRIEATSVPTPTASHLTSMEAFFPTFNIMDTVHMLHWD